MDLTYFNPNSLDESDFVRGFVARQRIFEFFMRQMKLVPRLGTARHHLIIAPRGFGKTSLLRRTAIGIKEDAELMARFIPLRFREEQHNVISLDVFWRNCLQSLAEAREDENAPLSEIDELDSAWAVNTPRQSLTQDEQDGEPAFRELHTHCQNLGRRPVLLIDNLDTLLAGLSVQNQWGLRRALQADDGPVLLAAASRFPAATHDQSSPFYEFFRIHQLDKLDDQEVFACLRHIALNRGKTGRQVLKLLDKDPGRVAALNTLAGGNPRTLSVLYGVLESHMSEDVLSQLSAMLDTFTGWYQARTEELAPQARAVFDALALNWDPMTAAALGLATGLDTTVVSSQLARLEKSGYAESVALNKGGKGRKGYQVSERFFNIWYLMRNGPRRAKQSIRFLTTFLQSCFSPSERRSIALTVLRNNRSDPGYALALASCFKGGRLRQQLVEQAYLRSKEIGLTGEYAPLIDGLRSDIYRVPEEEWRQGDVATEDDGIRRNDEIFSRYVNAKTIELQGEAIRALINKGVALFNDGRIREAIEISDQVVEVFGNRTEVVFAEGVARALLHKGVALTKLGLLDDALLVYQEIQNAYRHNDQTGVLEQAVKAAFNKAFLLGESGFLEQKISTYESILEMLSSEAGGPLSIYSLRALLSKASTLGALGKMEDEIGIYDDILKRYGGEVDHEMRLLVAKALFNKANALAEAGHVNEELSVYDEIVRRYRSFDDRDSKEIVARALLYKGITLGELAREDAEIRAYDEIVLAFNEAVEPKLKEYVLKALGNKALTLGRQNRLDEEIEVYDDLIRRADGEEWSLLKYAEAASLSKGVTLSARGQHAEAVSIFERVYVLYSKEPNSELKLMAVSALFNWAIVASEMGDVDREISLYSQLINEFGEIDDEVVEDQVAKALINRGVSLGNLGQFEEALTDFRRVTSRYLTATNSSVRPNCASALIGVAAMMEKQGDLEGELGAYDELLLHFSDNDTPQIQEDIASAMLNRAVVYGRAGKIDREIAGYNELIERYKSAQTPVLREFAVMAFSNKAIALENLGQAEEQILAFDQVVELFRGDVNSSIKAKVARVMLAKAVALNKLDRPEAQFATYDALIEHYSEETNDEVRNLVGDAFYWKANALRERKQYLESEKTFKEGIQLGCNQAQLYIGLGNLLLDYLGNTSDAIETYKDGLTVVADDSDKAILNANLAYAILFAGGGFANARAYAEAALRDHTTVSPAGRHLLAALPLWGEVGSKNTIDFDSVRSALECNDPKLWTFFADDLERILALILMCGRGSEFASWMDSQRFAEKFSPVYHAFLAVLNGEDHLLRINPETRRPALDLYEGVQRRTMVLRFDG